ncbi:hypothetical protein BC834DRAFT_845594 [Gloeopeniophorella convolvens]|nr:hypothetical protein BC834DRAFT_845594 [Gloeopeniophorella convolvens]
MQQNAIASHSDRALIQGACMVLGWQVWLLAMPASLHVGRVKGWARLVVVPVGHAPPVAACIMSAGPVPCSVGIVGREQHTNATGVGEWNGDDDREGGENQSIDVLRTPHYRHSTLGQRPRFPVPSSRNKICVSGDGTGWCRGTGMAKSMGEGVVHGWSNDSDG